MRSASSAVRRSPVIRYSLARLMPTSIGHSTGPPSPATMPAFTCGSPMRAPSAMYTTSQNSASVAPSPIAWPLMAAIIG